MLRFYGKIISFSKTFKPDSNIHLLKVFCGVIEVQWGAAEPDGAPINPIVILEKTELFETIIEVPYCEEYFTKVAELFLVLTWYRFYTSSKVHQESLRI